MTPFGGWEMPLNYPTGTIVEHETCRTSAVVFDVSHLGTVRVDDAGAFDRIQAVLTNDLGKIGPGRAQYTHLLDEAGSVVDDIIVWWHADGRTFDVMPNASNTEHVLDSLGGRDVTADRAVLAVQGPQFADLLRPVLPEAAEIRRFTVHEIEWRGHRLVVAGTGYTGERGVEIAVPASAAHELWTQILAAGVPPAGLGARDTLRLEAGLPLHGHELGPGITPLQAGLEWVVGWSKPAFLGKAALEAERSRGVTRVLRGVSTEGRRPPRAECPVSVDGRVVGATTSGNFSPTLGHGVALAFLDPTVDVGSHCEVDVRGSKLEGRVVSLPFVRRA